MNLSFNKKIIKYSFSVIIILSILAINYFSFSKLRLINDSIYYDGRRDKLESIIKDKNLNNSQYILVISDSGSGYYYYLLRYLLYSERVSTIDMSDGIPSNLHEYDYLINLTENNEVLNNYLENTFPLQKYSKIINLKSS